MKTIFKKSIALLAALAFTFASLADSVIYNPTTTAAASLVRKGGAIQQIIFSNAATNSVTLTFTDAPTNALTWVQGVYTNNVYTLGNVVTTFTNITGQVESSTNLTLTSTLTTAAASTNSYRTLFTQLVPASSTVTYTPPLSLPFGFGIAGATTATNVTATITYILNQ